MAKDAADPRAAFLRARDLRVPLLGDPTPRSASRLLLVDGSTKRVRPARQGDGTWPTATDKWCWYCCHPFGTPPLPMPIKYDDKRDVFHVMGTFCSWACMKAFNLDSSSYMKPVNANNITLLHKRCTGSLARIRPAPPRQALAVFGGTMSIEEFRAASGRPLEYAVLPPRMIVHHHAIQETDVSRPLRFTTAPGQERRPAPLKRAPPDLADVVDFKDVSAKNEPLRLKRPKPLQNNRNLLERTMGIGALLAGRSL